MLARLFVQMPYTMTLVEGEQFPVYEGIEGEYTVRFLPPIRSADLQSPNAPSDLTLDGKPAFEANVMRIDFYKDQFTRKSGGPMDPPQELIAKVVDWFHSRLRFVTRATHARAPSFPLNQWRLEYTNDDGSPLEKVEGLARAWGALAFQWSFIGVSKETWQHIFSLPNDFEIPVWDELRLDAQAALPAVGTSVVLGASALEVFVSVILDSLAAKNGFPPELWKWINERGEKRGNPLRQPSVDEQFDALLKHFVGHSLKDEPALWEAFRNLKTARNSFVHDGVAKVGGTPVDNGQAIALLGKVNEIIEKVRTWLPDELKWHQPAVSVEFKWTQGLFGPSRDGRPPDASSVS
jgi:hypothetical protein